jgi:hypothetical protein
MLKHLDIIETDGGHRAIVDTVYAEGTCTVWLETSGNSVSFMALPRRELWRVVG